MRKAMERVRQVVAYLLFVLIIGAIPAQVAADFIDLGAAGEKYKRERQALFPSEAKIDARFSTVLTRLRDLGATRANARGLHVAALSNPLVKLDEDGTVQVNIRVASLGEAELVTLEDYEVTVEIANEELGIVQGWILFDRIQDIADLSFVTRITAPSYLRPRGHNAATEGDAILRADELRALGPDGSGVKVGVISIGANNIATAQATGDLPPGITVFPFPGSCSPAEWGVVCDEGTAMLEIVHDLAPGAQLGFGAADTVLAFIQRISDLANTFGADVIVDDLGAFGEPFFEDGPLADAVAAVADNLVYVTSAGNGALEHYEAGYLGTPDPYGLTGDVHNFGGAAGGGSDLTMDVRIDPGQAILVFLQWNDPFGGSANDYDLFLLNQAENDSVCVFDGSTCFPFSTEFQTGTQDPIEAVFFFNSTGVPVTGKIVVNRFAGVTRRLEMFVLGGHFPTAIQQYNVPDGSIFGHAGVPSALATGAISACASEHAGDELFACSPLNDIIEPFSSRGPAEIFFPGHVVRPKPDLTGIDGVSVSGAGGFPDVFYGTSGTSPHAAGVAALLKEISPTAAPAMIFDALKNSAVDLGVAGTDNIYGAGRVDAVAAMHRLTGLRPLSGDWNGNGMDTIGLYDPVNGVFFLRNSNDSGVADVTFRYGPKGAALRPMTGDWNGNGVDTIGLYDPVHGVFFLRDSNDSGVADLTFRYGPKAAALRPVTGDWNGSGVDTIGLYDPVAGVFFLRNSNDSGVADLTFRYGPRGLVFLALLSQIGVSEEQAELAIGLAASSNANGELVFSEAVNLAYDIEEALMTDPPMAANVTSISFTAVGETTNAVVVPAIPGVTVVFTVRGTDAFFDTGKLLTDAYGTVSFFIPPGALGLTDTISVSAILSGRTARTTHIWP